MSDTVCNLEDACQRAQDMINQVPRCWKNAQDWNTLALTSDKLSQKKEQIYSKHSIHSKLTRLYFEELTKAPHATPDSVLNNLENECDLVGRLVQREGLHTLIVNLYAGNKGYSLAVRNSDKGNQYDKNSILTETQLMGYEQGELLSCIDNGQLPAMLAEQLESNHSHLFYDGCIVAEIRDYRKASSHNKAEIHHVLLKPSTQSVLSDVSTLTSDGDWSHEERLMLESRLVAATQGPLCLDPNPIPTLVSTRLKQSKSLLTDHQLMRQAKKFSQVTVNRKRKLEQLAQMALSERPTILKYVEERMKRGLTTSTACPPPSLTNPPLLPPSTPVEVLRFAKAYERPRETKDCSPQVIEEYILEAPGNQGEVDHIKLSILQRPATSEYLGELYMDKNHREGEKNGASCRFTLGTRTVANHYYQQFKEIFTEEGRKNVRIKHIVPGQVPRTSTSGMRVHPQTQQVKAVQLVAQQLQQTQSPHLAQQILSRAQGQLNTLAGQVTSMKTITEATTSTHNNLSCVDTTDMSQLIPCDATTLSSGHTLTNGGAPNVTATSVQIDNAAMTVTDSTCNGSGILVFQQKSASTINNVTSTNVPVLQAQLQAGTQNCIGETTNQSQSEPPFKKHSTNPRISALATSLMNSAQQFQQQAAANAKAAAMNNNAQASSNKSSNAAILGLLNSTPANLTQQKLQPRRNSLNTIPPRVISHGNVINVPSSTGQVRVSLSSTLSGQLGCKQLPVKATAVRLARVQDSTSTLGLSMPELSALLAGTPSADNPIPGVNSASSLLERLTASSNQGSQSSSPMTTPSSASVNLQSVNLTSLPNSINGLQNVQVSFPGLSQPITMSLNVSATTGGTVTPAGVIVSLPISTATNTCTTVSSMIATTVVTTAIAGSTPTVVIANPANASLSLPIAHAQIIASGVKGLSQQNLRSNNAVTLATQGGQAIQLIGSQRPRLNNMTRQVQSNQVKSAVLSNQLVTVAKTVTASQLILSGNKQVLTPIMAATKPVFMASQATPSSQVVPVNKQTLLTKSLHARASTGQCSQQTQSLGVTTLSQQQLQQLQQCLAAQHKVAVATASSQSRTHIETQRTSTSTPGEDLA